MQNKTVITNPKSKLSFTLYMIVGLVFLIIVIAGSISFGAAKMDVSTAWKAILEFNPDITEHQIIRTLRLPRTFGDVIVGASLAVAGAIMQGSTRNPLADSGLMGVNSGATFAIALCLAFFKEHTYFELSIFSFIGAGIGVFATYFIAALSKRGITPQRLVLSGISISMLFSAMSSFIGIKYNIGQQLSYWSAGGVASISWNDLMVVLPWFIVGIIVSVILSPSVTVLSLGEEVAKGLGQKTKIVKSIASVVVLILAGISVAIAGPIGFVGLIVPHIIRFFVGVDYRYIIPASALYGASFMVAADLIGRLVNRPYETTLGIIFSIIGVPFFLYISRKERSAFG
ncbi:MAG: iron ABC transporter permease [Clostridiaceae bacterium]